MVRLHPSSQELMAYSAGDLSTAKLLCIATHLEYCARCRDDVRRFNSLGGAFFEEEAPVAVSDALFDQIMSKTRGTPPPVRRQAGVAGSSKSIIPRPLLKLIPDGYDALPWKKLGKSLRITYLPVADKDFEVSMQRIAPGGRVFEHGHKGEEITVVLKGSFSDHEGCYQPGDFVVRNTEDQHEPVASTDAECICLSLLSEPIRFTGPLTRMLNPFLQVHK